MSEKQQRERGLFPILLLMILVAPTQWGLTVKGIPFAPADLVLGVGFLAWAVLVVGRRVSPVIPPACLWMLVAVALASAVNAIRAVNTGQGFAPMAPGYEIAGTPLKSVAEVVQLVEYFLVAYVLVFSAVREEQHARGASLALAAVTALVVLGGLFHYVTRADEPFFVRSSFGSRGIYGGYLAMTLPVVFAMALDSVDTRLRLGLFAVVIAGAVTILSPGALIGLITALLLVAARSSSRVLQATLAGVLAFGVVTAVALPRNYDQNVYQFLHFRTADEQQLRAQWREWIAGVFITQEHPLLGVGPGNFQQNLANAYGAHGLEYPGKARPGADLASGLMEPDTNNLYVVTAATTGLLGLAALLWMLIYFGKTASAVVRRPGSGVARVLALGIWGGIIGFAVTSIFSSLLVRGTGVVLAIFFALAAVLYDRRWPATGTTEGGASELLVF